MDNKEVNGFIALLNDVIIKEYQNDYNGDLSCFRPSALSNGCNRGIYFDITQQINETPKDSNLIGILESGTTRHAILQDYIIKMSNHYDVQWIPIKDYVKKFNLNYINIISEGKTETRCLDTRYNISFAVDGILLIKGNYYLLEIKTETVFKYRKHKEPFEKHIMQANTYCLCLQLDNILFLYENRDNCEKKAYYHQSTLEEKQLIINKIKKINKYLINKEIPPASRDISKCKYCNYKAKCKKLKTEVMVDAKEKE